MSFINSHQFTGWLGADPETTEGGLVTGRIAVRNPAKKGQDGTAGADWFAFEAFNGIRKVSVSPMLAMATAAAMMK
jgi:hypothetical protein